MNEFNLSEKIGEMDDYDIPYIKVEDVKEFIKRLKEESYWINGQSDLINIIDKLAGNSLITADLSSSDLKKIEKYFLERNHGKSKLNNCGDKDVK